MAVNDNQTDVFFADEGKYPMHIAMSFEEFKNQLSKFDDRNDSKKK